MAVVRGLTSFVYQELLLLITFKKTSLLALLRAGLVLQVLYLLYQVNVDGD